MLHVWSVGDVSASVIPNFVMVFWEGPSVAGC